MISLRTGRRGRGSSGKAWLEAIGGQSAAELANAILEVIERGGRHAWVEVVELCATARKVSPRVERRGEQITKKARSRAR